MYNLYSETLNKSYIERIHQMSYSSLSDNGMLQIFSFLIKWLYLKLFPFIHGYLFIFANTKIYVIYRASHIILDNLQSSTPK